MHTKPVTNVGVEHSAQVGPWTERPSANRSPRTRWTGSALERAPCSWLWNRRWSRGCECEQKHQWVYLIKKKKKNRAGGFMKETLGVMEEKEVLLFSFTWVFYFDLMLDFQSSAVSPGIALTCHLCPSRTLPPWLFCWGAKKKVRTTLFFWRQSKAHLHLSVLESLTFILLLGC